MKYTVLPALAVLFLATPLWAHGIDHKISIEKAYCIRVSYDDGEPVSYAKVKVFGPAGTETEYQNGRTDQNGGFAFVPDTEGEWTVQVSDGLGHAVTGKINFGNEELTKGHQPASADAPEEKTGKAMACLSAIFLIFGSLFWWKGMKAGKNRSGPPQ